MRHYDYRWLYGIVLFWFIMLFGYCYLIQPEHEALRSAAKIEKKLKAAAMRSQTLQVEVMPAASSHPYQYTDALSMLFLSAHKAGATLQRVHLQISLPAQDSVQLAAAGSFKQLANFIFTLQHQPILMMVTDFSWRLPSINQLTLNMTVQLLKYGMPRKQFNDNQFSNTDSAFCTADKSLSDVRVNLAQAQTIPLAWLKMAAYLRQDNRIEAWVRLPNDGLISVKKADRIGKEHAVITQITPEQIVMTTAQGKRVIKSEYMNAH